MPKFVISPPPEERGFDSFSFDKLSQIAVDTETTGLDPYGKRGVDRKYSPCRPFYTSMSDSEGNTASIRWSFNPFTRKVHITESENFTRFKRCMASEKVLKVFANYKFDFMMLKSIGVDVRGPVRDVLLVQYCLDPTFPIKDLKGLAKRLLNMGDEDEGALTASAIQGRREGKSKGWALAEDVKGDYCLADKEVLDKYGRLDALRTMSLHLAQEDYLGDEDNVGTKFPKNVTDLIDREHKVMKVLSQMEQTGVRVSEETITELKEFYGNITHKHGQVIKKEAGKEFNPNSWQQKQQEFFGRREFKPLIYSSSGRGKKLKFSQCVWCGGEGCKICQNTGKSPKCDADFLDSIGIEHSGDGLKPKDPLAFAMLHNSAASTMLGFVDQYKEKAVTVPHEGEHLLILHPNFNQTKVVTTRLSSSQPNLQNVATDESGKKKTDIPYRVREVFIPRPGKAFLAPDYSQIEVWVLALLADAKEMLKRMAGGEDAHQTVADMVWPGSYDRVLVKRAKAKEKNGDKLSPQEAAEKKKASTVRKRIKNINFGIIYGAGDDKVGAAIGVSAQEAKEMKALYFEKFPAVRKFMEHIQASGKANRYVDSPYGVRYYAERGSEYKLTNYIIQGSAAQLLKSGMIALHDLFERRFKGVAEMLLQIHDELLIECDIPLSEDVKFLRMVEQAMSVDWQFLGSPIQFPIGMKRSTISWGSVKEISV